MTLTKKKSLAVDNHFAKMTAEELEAHVGREEARVATEGCTFCERFTDEGPRHYGSQSCESGSIASGGPNTHCTCDTCF